MSTETSPPIGIAATRIVTQIAIIGATISPVLVAGLEATVLYLLVVAGLLAFVGITAQYLNHKGWNNR